MNIRNWTDNSSNGLKFSTALNSYNVYSGSKTLKSVQICISDETYFLMIGSKISSYQISIGSKKQLQWSSICIPCNTRWSTLNRPLLCFQWKYLLSSRVTIFPWASCQRKMLNERIAANFRNKVKPVDDGMFTESIKLYSRTFMR